MSLFDTSHSYSEMPEQGDFLLQAHPRYEILLFLKGNIKFNVEGNIYHLKKGDMALVSSAESHYVYLDSAATYERIVIEFYPSVLNQFACKPKLLAAFNNRPVGKFNHYSAALFPNNKWTYFAEKCNAAPTDEEKLCYLLPWLLDINDCFERVKESPQAKVGFWQNDIAFPIIEYMNNNLTASLSLDDICKRFFLSKNQLNRIIKKATNTTVWSYITTKRLIYANELLYQGTPPLKACEYCGFSDYPTFYKAYKKYFGHAPSADYVRKSLK